MKNQSELLSQKTPICKVCFRSIEQTTYHGFLFKNQTICHDCFLSLKPVLNEFKIDGIKCLNLYYYTEKIQELLYQFKGCKDYELRTVFIEYYKQYLNFKFKKYTIIPAPSFSKNDEDRGFNHVIEMYSILGLKMERIIHKIKQVKQADLSSEERQKIGDVLVIDDVDLTNKRILIVDDVFTTGSTIRSMIKLIKSKNPKEIKVLVMAKTIDLDKR